MTVGVIFGGKSCEHDVSIVTACQAMAEADFDIVPIYVTQDGVWLTHPAFVTVSGVKNVCNVRRARRVHIEPFDSHLYAGRRRIARLDAILVAMHGVHGEDGMIAAMAESSDIPYTSCSIAPSGIGMDKIATKYLCRGLGLDTVPFAVLTGLDVPFAAEKCAEAGLSFPVVVKPVTLGSSIGIAMAHDGEELAAALGVALCYDTRAVVEQGITARREFNCAALSTRDGTVVSEIEEVGGLDEVLSFADKYLRGGKVKGMDGIARRIADDLDGALAAAVRDATERLYTAIAAKGVVRVDFLYDTEEKRLYVNELNMIPGSFAYYLFPDLGMRGVLHALLDAADARAADCRALTYRYRAPLHAK